MNFVTTLRQVSRDWKTMNKSCGNRFKELHRFAALEKLTHCAARAFFETLVTNPNPLTSIFGTSRNVLMRYNWTVGRPNLTGMMYRWRIYPNRNSRWRALTASRYDKLWSQLLYKVPTASTNPNRHFCGQGTQGTNVETGAMLVWVQIKESRQNTGSRSETTQYLSFYTRYPRNSKATHTLVESSNTAGLVWTLADIGVSDKAKIAAINGSTNEIIQYLSFYAWWQRTSKGYTDFMGAATR